MYDSYIDFDYLLGKIITNIHNSANEALVFTLDNGEVLQLYHQSDCCESVTIDDICGELDWLLNTPILQAEESTSDINPEGVTKEWQDSFTWTFYKLATINGYVTIRWYGESNGHYSEDVSFVRIKEKMDTKCELCGGQSDMEFSGAVIAPNGGSVLATGDICLACWGCYPDDAAIATILLTKQFIKEREIVCECCGYNLTQRKGTPKWRLVLRAEEVPHVGRVLEIHVPNPLDEIVYFCGLGCLSQWLRSKGY